MKCNHYNKDNAFTSKFDLEPLSNCKKDKGILVYKIINDFTNSQHSLQHSKKTDKRAW